MTRIAFIVGDLGFGGATTLLLHLATSFIQRNIPVQIQCLNRENAYESEFAKLKNCVFFPDRNDSIFEDKMAEICHQLAAFQPTVVIGWLGTASYEVLRYIPQGVMRLGVVHCDHETFYQALYPFTSYLDGLVAVSTGIGQKLSTMPVFGKAAIHSIPNGIPIPATPPTHPQNQPLRILYLGRLEGVQKRVRLFPAILKNLIASGIPFQWTVAGQGPERAFLEDNMRTENPSQTVVFAGNVPYDQIPALLVQHDILLLASASEGLPISLLEAMGHGLVPVISDIESGIRDVVDATNGMLVPIDDIPGYARAIVWLHEHRDTLATMHQAAWVRVSKEYSIAVMTDRWVEIFEKTKEAEVQWPRKFCIQAPLEFENRLEFLPVLRPVRRILKKLAHLRSQDRRKQCSD